MKYVTILLFAIPPFVSAHDGNDGWVTLRNFSLWSNTHETDTIRVEVVDGYYNPAQTCSNPDSYMVSSALSFEARSRIYSTLLAATLASKSIVAYINPSSCEKDRPQILNVKISSL